MKYTHVELVPEKKRVTINQKILQLIQSNNSISEGNHSTTLTSISPADVFACYTGLGKLHGLQRSDYDNYHEYSEAKKVKELGQFFTPPALCQKVVELLELTPSDVVADLACGSGNFINALPNEANAYGCEVEPKACKIARFLYPQATITEQDIQYYQPNVYFDAVVGNPPFNFKFTYQGETITSQLFYCLKAAELLKPGGLLAIIVPQSFLNDEFFCKTEIALVNKKLDFVVQSLLPEDVFASVGMRAVRTKLMIFRKRSPHLPEQNYQTICEAISFSELNMKVAPALEQHRATRSKLTLEFAQYGTCGERLREKIKKLLYEIRVHPRIQSYEPEAYALVRQLTDQKRPQGMTASHWEEVKLTPSTVLSRLKAIVKQQNSVPCEKIRLVKNQYGFHLKGYSEKTTEQINKLRKEGKPTKFSLVEFLNDSRSLPKVRCHAAREREGYQKLIAAKRRAYQKQNQPWQQMQRCPTIDQFVARFTFLDKNNCLAQLTTIQQQDLGLALQKPYCQLNWEKGGGKTIAGYAWANYRQQYNHCQNVFICSAAIAIHMTWEPFLVQHSRSYVKVGSIADFERIQPGDFVLLTLEMTIRFQRQIKRFIREAARKVALVFDESDAITNHQTRINQAMQSCFARLPYKLNTTGTSTRNHINELYPQLRLLYNNSINMLSTAPRIFREVHITEKEVLHKSLAGKQIQEELNPYVGLPFPARGGQELFKACFCPTRATVFGIEKENQDIRQEAHLRPLIIKTIITRRFKEIAGDKYTISSHRIKQNPLEVAVYQKVMNEFASMMNQYFCSIGDSKKDSMLRIIRQIQLLIRACSVPHTFQEYQDASILPAKFNYIDSLIKKCHHKALVGTTTKQGAQAYYQYLSERFALTPIYLITGSTSFEKRKKIVAEFEQHPQAIIIANQQAMSSSVSIRSCAHVILESLQWNIPRMSQFYFRAIRFDSASPVTVHFITYERSIEQNLLALLMAKERLNEYIKTLEFAEREDVFGSFDIDLSLLNSLISKQYDEKGKMYLSWGKQQAV